MASVACRVGAQRLAAPALRSRTNLESRKLVSDAVLRQSTLRRASGISAFHTTAQKRILPPGPQVLEGGVNDPAPVPPRSPSHGSYHWIMERSVAAGLIPLTLAPFAGGSVSPYTDAALCALLLIHSHMGFQQIIVDYIPTKDHPTARKLFGWGLMAGTAVVGIGLYEFETTDIGITETVKRIWRA